MKKSDNSASEQNHVMAPQQTGSSTVAQAGIRRSAPAVILADGRVTRY